MFPRLPRRRLSPLAAALLAETLAAAVAFAPSVARADDTFVLEGDLAPDGLDHVFLDFDVPAGTLEIEVEHDDLSDANILDWGLDGPFGFRGWGGGNTENAIVGEGAASRSYLRGPIEPGTWRVVVGKAKVAALPLAYRVAITLRDTAPTLAAEPFAPYAPGVLSAEARWYAGDFHVHSRESGDASPGIDELTAFAAGKGLDFVELSEHNTTSQLEELGAAQAAAPELLLLPGIEYTTYDGHANAIGATAWVDHRIGQPGTTIEAAADAVHAQGALFSVNHPVLDLGDLCIGCAWDHTLDAGRIDAVEIATGGWMQSGLFFSEAAIAFWDSLCAEGHHIAAIGGSDDHSGGDASGMFASPIGDPTTMVFASELSVAGIVAGVKAGRTVVKLQGPGDPMVELTTDPPLAGDSAKGELVRVRARVTGGAGQSVRFVQNGAPVGLVEVDADPFETTLDVTPPASGETRVRAEVLVDYAPRTVTSHVWLSHGEGGPMGTGGSGGDGAGAGCGCAVAGAGGRASGHPTEWAPWVAMGFALSAAARKKAPGKKAPRAAQRVPWA